MDVLTDLSARGRRLRRVPLFATLFFNLELCDTRVNQPPRQHEYKNQASFTYMRRVSHVGSPHLISHRLNLLPKGVS